MRTITRGVLVLTMVSAGTVVAAHPSAAACAPEKPRFTLSNAKNSYRPTNVMSDFIQGPGRINYSKTKTATAGWSGSAGIGADIDLLVVKISNDYEGTYTKSWSDSDTWTYSLDIARGKTQRIRMYHASKKVNVTKKVFNNGQCRWRTAYTNKTVDVPKRQNVNVWKRENL
jgi:hypothetical protein